jgi:hypothetical protein
MFFTKTDDLWDEPIPQGWYRIADEEIADEVDDEGAEPSAYAVFHNKQGDLAAGAFGNILYFKKWERLFDKNAGDMRFELQKGGKIRKLAGEKLFKQAAARHSKVYYYEINPKNGLAIVDPHLSSDPGKIF